MLWQCKYLLVRMQARLHVHLCERICVCALVPNNYYSNNEIATTTGFSKSFNNFIKSVQLLQISAQLIVRYISCNLD